MNSAHCFYNLVLQTLSSALEVMGEQQGVSDGKRYLVYGTILVVLVLLSSRLEEQKSSIMLQSAKAVSIVGHLTAVVLYYRVKAYINDSYTSYTSENEFGYSNIEKAQFRAENKRISRILLVRGLLGWMTSFVMPASLKAYESVPIWITSLMGYETMDAFVLYVKLFWNPNEKKMPRGNIPRSQSGRLI